MKKIIFILSLLLTSFIAMSQCCVYLRADSVIVMKQNGTAELVVRNKTKDTVGGVLTNIGNGITEFRTPGASGSGKNFGQADTVSTGNRHFNNNDFDFTYLKGHTLYKPLDTMGVVFDYDFATNPVDASKITTAFSTGTFTPGGGHTVVGGTLGRNENNFIELNHYLGTENWRIGSALKMAAKNGTSYGWAVTIPISAGMGISLTVNFDLADSSGSISYQEGGVVPDFVTSNLHSSRFTWLSTDSIAWYIEKTRRNLLAVLHNYRTGDESVLNITGYVTHQVNKPRIYYYSGSTLFTHLTITDNGYRNPDVAIIGNSITNGSLAPTYQTSWHEGYTGSMGYYSTLMASPAETSVQGYLRVPEAIACGTPLVIWDPGPNDASLDTLSKYLILGVHAMVAAGQKVILMTAIPNDGFSVVPRNDTIRAVAAREGAYVCDTYPSLVNPAGGTGMNPDYDADGTHPNMNGQQKIISLVVSSTLKAGFNKRRNIFNVNLPSITTGGDYVKLGPNGFAVSNLTVDSTYWPVQHEPWSANVPSTSGNLFSVNGNLFFGGDVRFGGQSWNSPYFRVSNSDGYTHALLFISQNMVNFANGTTQFDGTNGGPYKKVQFAAGAYLLGFQAPLILKSNYPGTSSGSVLIDNDDENYPTSSYRILQLALTSPGDVTNNNSYFDRRGGLHITDTIGTGYDFAVDYTALGNNAFPTKRHLDSLIATVSGGGGANLGLSNLSGVAINLALLPGTDNSIAIGSSGKQWTNVFLTGAITWSDANISHTAGAEVRVAPADGNFDVFKSGQANTLRIINSSFTDGLSLQSSSNIIRTLSGASPIQIVPAAAESLGVGGAPTTASIKFEVITTTKFSKAFPTMTTAQRNAISSPSAGDGVYCNDCTATDASTGVITIWNGSAWKNCW